MPKLSDDDSDDGESKRNEKKANDDRRNRPSEAKGHSRERKSAKDDESRRNLKWVSFSKPRMVFGFDHLGTSNVPIMSGKTRGISMCFEKISGWHVPPQIYQDLGFGLNNFEFSVQLSLSMFHLTSSSFFGSTWMGRSVPLGNENEEIPDLIDLEYNEIVYLISRLADPSCIGVVEIVISKISTQKKLVTAQYGCGWTIINLFSLPPPQDLENGHESVQVTSCPFFQGSPRDLALNSNISILKARLKEISGCSLQFKLYSQRKLLKAQRLIAENEAIGRFDIVPGVVAKYVTLPGVTTQKALCCIGDEELVIGGRDGGVFLVPTSPSIMSPTTINISDCQVHIPGRVALESRVKGMIATNVAAVLDKDEVRILSRTLKIGLHNGHTVVGGEWQSVTLQEDRDDKDVLLTKEQTISVNGYVPHEFMALAILLEYEVGAAAPQRSQHSAQTILNSTSKDGKVVTVVTLGVCIYVPFNGEKMILRNGIQRPSGKENSRNDDEELGIELSLRTDDVCTILTPKPLFSSMDSAEGIKGKKKTSSATRKADSKSSKGRDIDDVNGSSRGDTDKAVSSIKIAFDLSVIDPVRGDVITDHEWVPTMLHNEDEGDDADAGHGGGAGLPSPVTGRGRDKDLRSLKPHRESTASSRKGISASTSKRRKSTANDGYDSDGTYSVSESIVGGDSENSNLVLDPLLYSGRHHIGPHTKRNELVAYESEQLNSQFNIPRDRGSLLAQTMQAKLKIGGSERGRGRGDNDVLEDYEGGIPSQQTKRGDTDSTVGVGMTRSTVTMVTKGGVNHARELSRGARSRLGRHGFDGAIMDSNADYDGRTGAGAGAAHSGQLSNPYPSRAVYPIDTALEARDVLSLHEISIQFAGFRLGPAVGAGDSSASTYPHPRSVYFSYQFFSCEPTRTEVMRLLPSDKGEVSVLCRDDAHARDEAPLALRYLVDCSDSSPTEGYDFAEYMAKHSLFIDVWDSDSLLLLGTCCVPLKGVMRQGQPVARCAMECDVIDSETHVRAINGVTTTVILDGGIGVGVVVGAVQVILSNKGEQGKNRVTNALLDQREKQSTLAVQGLNWRAHQQTLALALAPSAGRGKSRHRPRVSVRARPLSENAPELNQALQAHRGEDGRSMRSLTSMRGGENERTLTYDDVAILFKRFQGPLKGTVQYSGALMTLLDIPSWAASLRKLVKIYQLAGGRPGLERELAQYTDPRDCIASKDLSECFKDILDRHGISHRVEEIAILVNHFEKDSGTDRDIEARDVLEYCKVEMDRQVWMQASKHVRSTVQKAYISGLDVEQELVEKDRDGDHFITSQDFALFLKEMSKHKKLSQSDIDAAVGHFSRDHGPGSGSSIQGTCVSLKEVVAYIGKQYVGNVVARIRQCITVHESSGVVSGSGKGSGKGTDSGTDPRPPSEILHILKGHNMDTNTKRRPDQMTLEGVEFALGSMGVFTDLSHEQVRRTVRTIDTVNIGLVTYARFFQYFEIPPPHDMPVTAAPSSSSSKSRGALGAEELLRSLLTQVQKNGLSVDEAFRHFDTDGNGFISSSELEQGLSLLGIFDDENISNWRVQVPEMVKKFDRSGNGTVSLRDFFSFLGAEDYVPNVIQRMTKIFSLATEKGLTFKDIFDELDEDKNGILDALELKKGLHRLGTFGEVSTEDAEAVVRQFDHSGDRNISLAEFISFFSSRVKQAAAERAEKIQSRVILKFCTAVSDACDVGVTVEKLFEAFDRENNGVVTTARLAAGLKMHVCFKALTDGDIQDLIEVLDYARTGDITLKQFKAFIAKHTPVSSEGSAGDKEGVTKRVIAAFSNAQDRGHTLADAIEQIDSREAGVISRADMTRALLDLPHLRGVTDEDVRAFVDILDAERKGMVSMDGFRSIIRDGQGQGQGQGREMVPFRAADKPTHVKSKRELFRDQIKRIARSDGGVDGLLAYLDEDEDGLIALSSFMRLLAREKAYTGISESDVESILQPMIGSSGSGRVEGIRVVALLRFMDSKDDDKDEEKSNSEGKSNSDDEEDEEKAEERNEARALTQVVEYDFSSDPETRSLEKKLRGLGRALCKKGMDVEGMFRAVDLRQTGIVRRTDFVEIMSKIGLSILEKGKAMDDAQAHVDSMDSAGDHSEARKNQILQIKRLKGTDGGYARTATRAARSMLMNTGSGEYKDKDRGDFKDHLESMVLIEWYRQSQKRILLQKVLSHSLATSVYIHPRFGITQFFEHPLTNPYGHEERFILSVEDPELRLVTGFDEWLHLRQHCKVCVGDLGSEPVEAEMFDKDGYGNIQVALLPHETLHLPFTFLRLHPYKYENKKIARKQGRSGSPSRRHSRTGGGRSNDEQSGEGKQREEDSRNQVTDKEDEILRTAEVRVVSCTHGHVVAVIRVNICPRPFVVHRTIRFFEPENGLMRRRIQLKSNKSPGYPGDRTAISRFVHCVEMEAEGEGDRAVVAEAGRASKSAQPHSKVVVEWGPSGAAGASTGALDILLRYRCGSFPSLGSFYLLIYDDPYQCKLYEAWHVVVQSRQRVDIHASLGSVSTVDLVVRGDRYARRARAYSSHCGDRMMFKPITTFQLVPGAFNRVAVQFSPNVAGTRRIQMNLVDTDSKELISAWLLNVSAATPATTRNYDVDILEDRPIHKKIIFKNPWDTSRRFTLTSSDNSIMRPRVPILEVTPHGNAYLRLWFNSSAASSLAALEGIGEVYLFLNDEAGQSEESFMFTVRQKI